jgi:uncharacterized protein YjbI with pentapeptide repeats
MADVASLRSAGALDEWISRHVNMRAPDDELITPLEGPTLEDRKSDWQKWLHKCVQCPLPDELRGILEALKDIQRTGSLNRQTNKPMFNTPEEEAAYEVKRNDLIEAWNKEWRKYTDFPNDDLPRSVTGLIDFSYGDHLPPSLAGYSFYLRDLRGFNLRNADLGLTESGKGGAHESANLTMANLRGANLFNNDLDNALLDGADLSEAYLVRTSFYKAKLRGAKLNDADLRGANFTGADLTNADLRGADLTGASLHEAVLDGADFRTTMGILVDENSVYRTRFDNRALWWRATTSAILRLDWVLQLFGRPRDFKQTTSYFEDRWSMLRRTYTGPNFFISLLFLVSFTIPFIAKALILTEVSRSQLAVLQRLEPPNNDQQNASDSAGAAPSRGIAAEYQFLQDRINDAIGNARAASARLPTLAASPTNVVSQLHALISPIEADLEQVKTRTEYVRQHVGEILLQSVREHRYPVWKILLGVDTGAYGWTVLICLLLVYNGARWLMTVLVAPMRDFEDRGQRTPARVEYQALMPIHHVVSTLYWLSFATAIYNFTALLTAPVYKFW